MNRLSGIALFILFPMLLIFRKRRITGCAVTLLLAMSFSSCYLNFFRAETSPTISEARLAGLKSDGKYFIIHFSNGNRGLEQVSLNGDMIQGRLVKVWYQHSKHLDPGPKTNLVKSRDIKYAMIEVHLYTSAAVKDDDSSFSAPASTFNRADVYELDESKTRSYRKLSTTGIITTAAVLTAGVLALALVSIALSCNCPQVYVQNNGSYNFASGMYSGAVYSTLERTDYLPLTTIAPDARSISFRIANAKEEEQFINQVQLWQVTHPAGTQVLSDRHGDLFTYNSLRAPITASTDKKNDIKSVLASPDGQYYSFDNKANKNGFSDVVLRFDKPAGAATAKLVIHGRNTYWAGLVHKEFISLFGEGYEKWRARQEQADPKELQQWQTDQALPLMVYLKTAAGWKFVDYFPLIGNTASRDMIMAINTDGITEDKIVLKLETAYRFWDLDFTGIDYSAAGDVRKNIITPLQATNTDGADQKALLLECDQQYSHLTGNDALTFKYAIPMSSGNTISSYFLVSGGYYHNLEPMSGKPNYAALYKFRKKGSFDRYSRSKYTEARDVSSLLAVKK